ncbi:hypothetical protein VP01_1274g2 [Puccinia sorghi]|uniref:LisH domain-containing protein n=1 Tax=Puccinia sorghi TaxID=27349 RepID=A0A0L6VQD2_9BASI|nr:hypothetical protein VP01_1274g2 [Puccinia sorghi]
MYEKEETTHLTHQPTASRTPSSLTTSAISLTLSTLSNLLQMTAAATALPGTSFNHTQDVSSSAPGPQNHKRPVGLTLTNPNPHGFPHYPVSAPSSSAPLPPAPPNHPPITQLHRNASFSHPPNYQNLISSQAVGSAPPSATTIPLSHSVSAMPFSNQLFPSQINPRPRLPTQPGSAPPQARANDVHPQGGYDLTASHPSLPGRPSTSSTPCPSNIPNGKPGSRDDSVVPPASLSNFPGLGFTVQPTSASPVKPGTHINPAASSPSTLEALRFFNTYLYDYLLKQGLFEVAGAFVASGVELDLVDGREGVSAPQFGSKPNQVNNNSHKRRRSEGSINAFNSSPHTGSNVLSTNEGANSSTQPKGGNAASELLPSERSMSSSGSSISNTPSHYGFNHTDSNRSSNETPSSQGPTSDPMTNPSGTNVPNGTTSTSPPTSASPRSSPLDCQSLRHHLPKPKLAMDTDQGFLFEWWSIFWDVFRAKTGRAPAQSKPAQVYAQTVAAASLGMPTEPGGLTKARRDALGILAVPNPLDAQKVQLNERIQQQYSLVTASPYSAPHSEPANVPATRLSPHQLQAKQAAALAEQARMQVTRMHQHQQYQRVEANMARQRQTQLQQQAQQQQQHAQVQQQQQQQQQQQELALRAQEAQLRQPSHMHQIHPAHHEQFAQQRQISMNVRRPGMMPNMSSDQAHAMMPPPPIQHGSPLNPHQQAYRPSRPPSRSGAAHVSSPFVANPAQPQRQPSRTSNHANSPAMQAHPRTPSASHASTPQPSAASTHNRASPAVSNGDQERKKRRLNDPIYNSNEVIPPEPTSLPPSAQHVHQLAHQHQLLTHQQQLAQHHQQQMALQQQQQQRMDQHHQQQLSQQQLSQQQQFNQQHQLNQHQPMSQPQQMSHQQQQLVQQHHMNHQVNQPHPSNQHHPLTAFHQQQMAQIQASRRGGAHHSEFAGSPSETSPMNMSAEAYKQSIHAKHSQVINTASGPANGPKGTNSTSPNKDAGSKSEENSMPPPSSRNIVTQPSTPQSSASANKATESTPLPSIVAPSPNINQPLRPASRNEQNQLAGGAAGNMCSTADPATATQSLPGRSMSNNDPEAKPNASTGDSQRVNESIESSAGVEHGVDKSMFTSEAGAKSHDKPGGLWSLDSNNGQHHPNLTNGGNVGSNMSPSANVGTQGLTSDDLNAVNSNAMDQLFGTDPMSFDLDGSLFDAFTFNSKHNPSRL